MLNTINYFASSSYNIMHAASRPTMSQLALLLLRSLTPLVSAYAIINNIEKKRNILSLGLQK